MRLPSLPDQMAPLAAGVLLLILTVSIVIVWRRRLAEERDRGDAVTSWPTGPGWRPGTVAEAVATAQWSASDRWESAYHEADADFPEFFDDDPRDDAHRDSSYRDGSYPGDELSVASVPTQRTAGSSRMGAVATEMSPDMRDRLVAVLLSDHEVAVGAMDELAACQQRLARLARATQEERALLGGLLTRLAETGLSTEQLARLADLPVAEVRGHLMTRA